MSSPPSRRNSWPNRLGKAVKRRATLFSRSSTSVNKVSDDASSSEVEAPSRLLTAPATFLAASSPSPIAESPAREAAAMNFIPLVGSSSLTQPTNEAEQLVQTADEAISTLNEYLPLIIDSSARNPPVFTDDPEELPPTELANDSYVLPTKPVSPIEASQQEHEHEHVEPLVHQESDSASLSKVNADSPSLTPPITPLAVSSASPVPGLPAQAVAVDSIPVNPSPLTQSITGAQEVVSIPAKSEYVPPSVVDYSVGNPGAFIDDPDGLPATELIDDPYADPTVPESVIEEFQHDYEFEHVEPAVEPPQHQSNDVTSEEPQEQQELMKVSVEAPHHEDVETTVEAPQQEQGPVKAAVEVPQMEKSVSLLDRSIMESIHDFELVERATLDFVKSVRESTSIAPVIIPSHAEQGYALGTENGEAPEYYQGKFEFKQPAPSVREQQKVAAPQWVESHHEPEHNYSLPSYSGQEVWGDIPVADDHKAYDGTAPVSTPPSSHKDDNGVHADHTSLTASIQHGPAEEPFDNSAPKVAAIHSDAAHMKHPEVATPNSQIVEKDQTGYRTDKGKNEVARNPHPMHKSLPSKAKAMALKVWDRAQVQFKDYPMWPVIGVGGAVAGMLATSFLLLRR